MHAGQNIISNIYPLFSHLRLVRVCRLLILLPRYKAAHLEYLISVFFSYILGSRVLHFLWQYKNQRYGFQSDICIFRILRSNNHTFCSPLARETELRRIHPPGLQKGGSRLSARMNYVLYSYYIGIVKRFFYQPNELHESH